MVFKIPATDIIFVFFQHLHTLQDLRLAFRLMFACVLCLSVCLCLFACACPIYVSCLSVYLIRTITHDKLILLASNHLPCLPMLLSPFFAASVYFYYYQLPLCVCVCVCVCVLACYVRQSVCQSVYTPAAVFHCLSVGSYSYFWRTPFISNFTLNFSLITSYV